MQKTDSTKSANFFKNGGYIQKQNTDNIQKPQMNNKILNNGKFNKSRNIFEDYISEEEAEIGIRNGTMFMGHIRINPKNYQECFLDNPKGTDHHDILVLKADRNRAFNGDLVVAQYKSKEEWLFNSAEFESNCPDLCISEGFQKDKVTLKEESIKRGIPIDDIPETLSIITAKVVRIAEKVHSRMAGGKLINPVNSNYVLFAAKDSKVPRVMIPNSDIDAEFFTRPKDFERFLYMAQVVDWPMDSIYAHGRLIKNLGESGSIEAETQRIILENGIDNSEFTDECLESIKFSDDFTIPMSEIEYRRDFRNETVFTIDPKTAKDLDDALSVRHIDDCDGKGNPGIEVGIHIADVSFFFDEETILDEWARKRGNSTYLAQMVIPMLPRLLCEKLCSLNPGVDRLSFSVVVKMTYDSELKDVWFGRTIIRSRVKLAYEHAQDFIENPDKEFVDSELPPISDDVPVSEIKEKVLMLHRVAQCLRNKREQNGSLRIDQPKLKFALEQETKTPVAVSVYEIKEANKLVEEFMLLANMEVAKKIEKEFPSLALLRRHPPPKEKIISTVMKKCAKIGFPLDGHSSRQLANSFQRYISGSVVHSCIRHVISSLTIKAMKQAEYFCVNSFPMKSSYRHYALNVDFYTHFTSPIRRYPDIIVHRQLAAALGYMSNSSRTADDYKTIAKRCNTTKSNSKTASEQSDELFFGVLIAKTGKISTKAVVMGVLDKAFDVLLIEYGIVKRVYLDKLDANFVSFDKKEGCLVLEWKKDEQAVDNREAFRSYIKMCIIVKIIVYPLPENVVGCILPRPTREERKVMEKNLKSMHEENYKLELD